MRPLLLDTHVVFWWFMDAQLTDEARRSISAPASTVYVSLASAWEVAIKQSIGKLTPPEDLADAAVAEGFQLLDIRTQHIRAVRGLPLHHRDPFDRMLVAQAQVERLTLVTRDLRLTQYDVRVLEA